jgi:hypothetical protein
MEAIKNHQIRQAQSVIANGSQQVAIFVVGTSKIIH